MSRNDLGTRGSVVEVDSRCLSVDGEQEWEISACESLDVVVVGAAPRFIRQSPAAYGGVLVL